MAMPVTHSLTHSCLVKLIEVTLACEDAYLKLVEVVTVADVDENCVGNNILQIWKLRFGHKAKIFFQTFSTMFGQDLKLEFRQDFYDEKIFYVGKKLVKLSTLGTLVTH